MSQENVKLTTGPILKTIIHFSLPFLISYFLQIFYGMADLFIIGQFKGIDSTTAVSIGSQVLYMFTVIILGLTMGTTVLIGQAVGAQKHRQTSKIVGNTAVVFLLVSLIMTGILFILTPQITFIMSTPQEAFLETIIYLRICFLGIPFITAYNVISAIFRGFGDSKSPMYFILIACIANIILDYIFIGIIGFNASGAALGTIISQGISVFISLCFILNHKTGIKFSIKDFKLDKKIVSSLITIGFPVALQNWLIQVAFIVITIIANKRGLYDAAAVGIVEKIIGILFLIPQTMLAVMPVLTAQNIGAGKFKRAKLALFYSSFISVCWGVIIALSVQFIAPNLIMLFTKNNQVIHLGTQYIKAYVLDCIFVGIHFCLSGYFYAFGLSVISFAHNFISIICVRIPVAYFASKYFTDTLYPMGLASPLGSLLSVCICISVFCWLDKYPRKNLKNLTTHGLKTLLNRL